MNWPKTLAVSAVLAFSSCKEAAPPPPPPPPAAKPASPPPPKVELKDAPSLPALPRGLAEVKDPEDNPTTPEKADLGHKLFFDKRLSKDGSQSCESCHHIEQAYTAGTATDAKVGGAMNARNAPSMLNLGYHSSFYWDGRKPTLEAVSQAAWTGQLGADPKAVAEALNQMPVYKALFQRAFKEDATADNVPKALAAWLRALKSGNSPWDKAQAGDKAALSKDAQAGEKLFSKLGCVQCHAPPFFSDFDFHNAGIGDDPGRKDATKDDADVGRFKTPGLRNVALTAPYFHDGKTATLDEAIALMAKGGNKNPHLDKKFKAQKLSKKDAAALKAFLEALTGESTYTAAPELP
ncbi:MAG: cytochrome-c peroxidase [Myxococcaceae bacterium]